MRLYLVQHGDAVPAEEDPERPLTERGRKDIARLGKHVLRTHPDVYRIEHSGRARAEQTAQILALAAKPTDGIHALDSIGPRGDVVALAERVNGYTGDRVIVSHQPLLSQLVDRLLMGKERAEPLVRFVPGTLVILDRDTGGTWSLVAVVPPALTTRA